MENGLILPVLAFQFQADEILQRRLADEGRTLEETARIAAVVHPDGNHVLLIPLDEFRFHDITTGRFPLGGIASRIFRGRPGLPDPRPVEPGLVAVVDGAQVQEDLVRGALFQGRRNPVLFQRQDRPVVVVESGLAPDRIVPFLETAFVNGNLRGCKDGPSQPQRDHQ